MQIIQQNAAQDKYAINLEMYHHWSHKVQVRVLSTFSLLDAQVSAELSFTSLGKKN